MIERMHFFNILVSCEDHITCLNKLRELGVLHIDKTQVSNSNLDLLDSKINLIDKITNLMSTKKVKNIKSKNLDLNSSDELVKKLETIINKIEKCDEKALELKKRYEDQVDFGSYDKDLRKYFIENKVDFNFYTVDKKAVQELKDIDYVVFDQNKNSLLIATLNSKRINNDLLTSFYFDDLSLKDLLKEKQKVLKEKENLNNEFIKNICYLESLKNLRTSLEETKEFTQVKLNSKNYDDIVRVTGFVPEDSLQKLIDFCNQNSYSYITDKASEEQNPPTKIKYKKGISIISPVFKILDTVPGYREKDISFWFLLFFVIFFAMIIGDAGYGLLFLITAIIMVIKKKGFDSNSRLLTVLSLATISWGAATGTWFGSSMILSHVKFLQYFVVDSLANYKQTSSGVWVSTSSSQNNIIRICFILAVIQLSLAYIINFISQAKSSIKAFAQIGNLFIVDSLFFLVLNLVLGDHHNTKIILYFVIAGLVLITIFGQQDKKVGFFKGILKGFSELLTTFLDMVGSFSNIISYIRLFAVGLASVAISQTFNNMAYQLFDIKTIIFAIVIIILGHSLNIIMGLLSVVVHGVRLNLLEFSGQLNMEWSGREYNPFRNKSPMMESKENDV